MGFTQQLQSFNETDEWYTPKTAVELILPYISKDKIIWCPFDTEESEFVKTFRKNDINVIASHIFNGQDFFIYRPKTHFDAIISNPPYSLRDKVLEHLYEINKPFAMLMNMNGLFDNKKRFDLFSRNGIQILTPRNRIKFLRFDGECASPPFKTVFVCYKLLPHSFCWEK